MPGPTAAPTGDHLEIKDSRTGKTYTVPITDDTIRTADLRQIKVKDEDFGMMGYDPAFMNTASCRSAITFIDGDKGILRYRGYPIEQLAERSTFLETTYLLIYGNLPTADALAELTGWRYGPDLAKWRAWWERHREVTPERWLEMRLDFQNSRVARLESELDAAKGQTVRLHQQLYARLGGAEISGAFRAGGG